MHVYIYIYNYVFLYIVKFILTVYAFEPESEKNRKHLQVVDFTERTAQSCCVRLFWGGQKKVGVWGLQLQTVVWFIPDGGFCLGLLSCYPQFHLDEHHCAICRVSSWLTSCDGLQKSEESDCFLPKTLMKHVKQTFGVNIHYRQDTFGKTILCEFVPISILQVPIDIHEVSYEYQWISTIITIHYSLYLFLCYIHFYLFGIPIRIYPWRPISDIIRPWNRQFFQVALRCTPCAYTFHGWKAWETDGRNQNGFHDFKGPWDVKIVNLSFIGCKWVARYRPTFDVL